MTSHWFERYGPPAPVRLVCLPHAGGGASVFQHWPGRVPGRLEVIGTRLPGRERRLRETPLEDWDEAVTAFADAVNGQIEPPYVLFGHSLGAMLAYQATVARLTPAPLKLVLAGCRSPDVPSLLPRLHDLPDPELAAGLGDLTQTPPEVLAAPALRRLFFPMLRADLRLAETWPPAEGLTVRVPLVTIGARDDPVAPVWSQDGWKALAGAGLTRFEVPGSHFFVHDPDTFRAALET
ncbi:thioesterase II family protein [Kineosporia succinea]|uniref:Medium-chain acyl-[acyl-carrier-protein] hydrolase n=1 Tax=Kineosporia succinea TaxID=84632 RepID=A0ABT9PED5_9ACTN|nr:alpha/beta fold hydrolase [Kineosporia succinea]MDP9831066.1 medium-chain acyl-[acyl-carrier-protein] hydrolase [Kineosporia succinea]